MVSGLARLIDTTYWGSSAAAAPVFHKIMSQVLKTYRVPPSTVPSPDLTTTY
jgi:cell division protein FtsI (penicillin-binding protein 3)